MIQEAHVRFETAKLLKEKGFDGEVHPVGSKNIYEPYKGRLIGNIAEHAIIAPTQQMAMRWLREEKEIVIVIKPHLVADGLCYVFIIEKLMSEDSTLITKIETIASGCCYDSYEDACEDAIRYCLTELI